MTKLRPEDALRRDSRRFRVAIDEPNRQPRDDDGGAEGSGGGGKSPTDSTRVCCECWVVAAVCGAEIEIREGLDAFADGDWGEFGRATEVRVPSEVPSREAPPVGAAPARVARNILGRRAAAANEKMLARSNSAADGLTRAPASGETTPRGSGEWSDGESEPGTGATPREATSPTISGRRVVGTARAGMEAMRVSDGGGGTGLAIPDQERGGAGFPALKRRQELSRDSFANRGGSAKGPRAREFPADGDDDASIHRRTSGEGEGGRAMEVRGLGPGVRTPSGFGVRPTG